MNSVSVARPQVRIALARASQELGWPGIVGVVLLAVAMIAAERAWTTRGAVAEAVAAARNVRAEPPPQVATAAPVPALRLQPKGAVALLLTRIERAATANGLPWAAGDYRLLPATDTQPAALEVRCAFKAPYPRLRAMLAELLRTLPATTFREMSFSRQTIDAEDVDAKFTIVVYLADDDALPRSRGER